MQVCPTVNTNPAGAPVQRGSWKVAKHREPNATRSNPQTNRAAMAAGRNAPSAYPAAHSTFADSIVGHEALYRSARKCWRGVGRKFSAQSYTLNIIERTVELSRQLKNGTYREGRTQVVHITYPKARTALSISFRDRVYQRSINDNALYPQVVRHFIYGNYACQRGKGTDAALKCLKAMLHRAWLNYRTNDFRILSADIRHYYDSMLHAETDRIFAGMTDAWTAGRVSHTLASQYKGDKGYNPGSQMVQIAGIAYLNGFDHYVKETLRRKLYIRYMDDFHIIGRDDAELLAVRRAAEENLAKVGLTIHPTKTRIRSAKDGIVFLGFLFRVTESGKVLMLRDPKRVKEIKRRLRRLAHKVWRGDAEPGTIDKSYECVRACMAKGNSIRLLRRMDDFVSKLKKGIDV